MPHRADLQHHDADRVGDDVVQLARDPRALLGDRDPGRGLALALGVRRALLGRLGLRGAPAQREAGEPGDHEQGRAEDQVAGRVVRVVVADDRRAADDDREPDPALARVARGCRAGTPPPSRPA